MKYMDQTNLNAVMRLSPKLSPRRIYGGGIHSMT
jgi:hypothetical protein